MSQTSYKIHLPNGSHITARNGTDLDNILSLNVCRVYQSQQIRIEPVFDRPKRRGFNLLQSKALTQPYDDWHREL